MSVVYGNTAVSNPGTTFIRIGGTSSTCSIRTRDSSDAIAFRTPSPGPTVLNMTSASADGDTTFGATPPLIRPTV